ncbi:hypothetical protein AGMMS4957_11910 [Bacteroidia bacterium]|nr:hypothetical protein AGMMS4957_11910 [Bacteroidia bacterium]
MIKMEEFLKMFDPTNIAGTVNTVCYSLFLIWIGCSIYWIVKLKRKQNPSAVNPYLYEAIPSVFSTLGIFGTFVGIFYGLQDFDVNKITESIPTLLEGLKTAFLTSIVGIVLSFIFGRWSQRILNKVEKGYTSSANNELSALHEIIKLLKDSKVEANQNSQILNKSLLGDTADSISTQIIKLRNQVIDTQNSQEEQLQLLENIYSAFGGDEDTSLLVQIQKLRAEQNDYAKETKKHIEFIVKSMNENNELISKKFDEFSELLAKNNTEALVNVMKEATEQFNAQMSSIVEKLVKENFGELNNSVQRMNQWQQENKEMITQLTAQFTKVSEDFAVSSDAIKTITDNTNKLTNENSHLSRLIQELQKVMIEDTKYQEIVEKLTKTIDTLKENTDAFDKTTDKLNNWVRNQMNFSDSVAKLLKQLEDIKKYKIETVPELLETINSEFYDRLSDTLINLDTLIQRIIANNSKL